MSFVVLRFDLNSMCCTCIDCKILRITLVVGNVDSHVPVGPSDVDNCIRRVNVHARFPIDYECTFVGYRLAVSIDCIKIVGLEFVIFHVSA
jgi:hypothetical protein